MKTELIKKAIFKNGRGWKFLGCIDMYQRKDTGDIIYGWSNAYHEQMERICSMSEFEETVNLLEVEFLTKCGFDLSNGYLEVDVVDHIKNNPSAWEGTCLGVTKIIETKSPNLFLEADLSIINYLEDKLNTVSKNSGKSSQIEADKLRELIHHLKNTVGKITRVYHKGYPE